MLKYLRIAVTISSLLACVLLSSLWVRSYRWQDSAYQRVPGICELMAWHLRGQVSFWASDIRGKNMSFSFGTRVVTHEAASDFPVWNSKFYYWESPNGTSFGFPYWFPIMIASALAAAPWILQPKRFSLRTLLIATTLVAVGLGIVALST